MYSMKGKAIHGFTLVLTLSVLAARVSPSPPPKVIERQKVIITEPKVVERVYNNGLVEAYTIYYSGYQQGFVTVTKNTTGQITIIINIKFIDDVAVGSMRIIDNNICPLLLTIFVRLNEDLRSIVIDGNKETWTNSDGSWSKTVTDGNTITWTNSDGSWSKTVTDGNTETRTYSDGSWYKSVTDGNTETWTSSDGSWYKSVTDGNTMTTTQSDDRWVKRVVERNK